MKLFWRRWLFLVLGGALFTPYAILALVVVPLAVPALAEASGTLLSMGAAVVLGSALVGTSLLPAVRTLEAAVVPVLLGGAAEDLVVAAPHSWGDQARGTTWYLLHTVGGAVVSVASVALPPVGVGLLVGAVVGNPVIPLGPETTPVDRAWAAPIGLGLLAAVAGLAGLAGAGMARLAPRLLGPGPAARLVELERRTAELTERSRLARELHDSIGHALTVTTLQASAARSVLGTDPDFAEQALLAIEQTGRVAAADLDDFLGLLREERSPRSPQPTLHDLDALVAPHRDSGMEVTLRVEGDLGAVPAVVSREVYRIVQEALTNVHRHAGSMPTTVRLTAAPGRLTVCVRNDSPERPRSGGPSRRPGRGLAGIRERVRLLGGQLETGPHDGGWRLLATVPTGGRR